MKKALLFLTLAGSISLLNGCTTSSGNTTNTANQSSVNANANQNSAVVVNTNSVNANLNVPPVSAEVPVYTDAQTALDGGKKYFDEGDEEKAIKALEQAIALDANLAEAHFQLGIAYELREKNSDEPVPVVKQSKNKKIKLPETPSVKQFQEAIKAYQKITAKNPKDATAHYFLGRSLSRIAEDEKAEKSLRQAVKLQPDDSEFNYQLGIVLSKLAKYAEAVKAFDKSLEIDPENGRIEAAREEAVAGRKRVEYGKSDKPKDAPPEPRSGGTSKSRSKSVAPSDSPNDKPAKSEGNSAPPTKSGTPPPKAKPTSKTN